MNEINDLKCRLNLTIYLWKSRGNKAYMATTAYFPSKIELLSRLLFLLHFPLFILQKLLNLNLMILY